MPLSRSRASTSRSQSFPALRSHPAFEVSTPGGSGTRCTASAGPCTPDRGIPRWGILDIELNGEHLREIEHIAPRDMPRIRPWMHRNAVASGVDSGLRRFEYVGNLPPARIAKNRDLIDVDAQIDHRDEANRAFKRRQFFALPIRFDSITSTKERPLPDRERRLRIFRAAERVHIQRASFSARLEIQEGT